MPEEEQTQNNAEVTEITLPFDEEKEQLKKDIEFYKTESEANKLRAEKAERERDEANSMMRHAKFEDKQPQKTSKDYINDLLG